MELDYFSEFYPLSQLARKFYLQGKLDKIEEARLAQADQKDYKKEVTRIANHIRDLDRNLRPATKKDYQRSWDMLYEKMRKS